MVDFVKRAARAGGSVLRPDETVLAATNVMPAPFSMAGSAAVGGAIAGGLIGGLAGAAVDKRREKKAAAEDAEQLVPALATRPPSKHAVPGNGALLAVTDRRLVVWAISGLGKPGEVLFEVPLGDIDAAAWQEADPKWMRGSPKSTLFWIGIGGGTVLPAAAISAGPAGKYVRAVTDALERLLPGRVQEFAP